MTPRTAIPKATRDRVLAEFNHRCALCGNDKPHLHHIDETPSNHDPFNLLPLCPNCHLTDQHNPTARANPAKLRLFRQYKDPMILTPQFQPLFERLSFLDSVETAEDMAAVSAAASELVAFVQALEMGSFYGDRLAALVKEPARFMMWAPNTTDAEYRQGVREHYERYRHALLQHRSRACALAVELLRYQKWSEEPPSR